MMRVARQRVSQSLSAASVWQRQAAQSSAVALPQIMHHWAPVAPVSCTTTGSGNQLGSSRLNGRLATLTQLHRLMSTAAASGNAAATPATPAASTESTSDSASSLSAEEQAQREWKPEDPPVYPPPSLLVRVLSTLALLPIAFLVYDGVGSFASVRGSSMQPTLNPGAIPGQPFSPVRATDDVVFVNKIGKGRYNYKRGEVVVLTSPRNPKIQTVKRLMGLEGDWVQDPDDPDRWVSEHAAQRDELKARPRCGLLLQLAARSALAAALIAQATMIPRGHMWIEGDNELTSIDDSRQFGAIPLGLLQGRVTHIVWPPSRWGRVRSSLEDERVKKPDNFRTI